MNTHGIDIALFDMDGSLADYEGALVRDLNELRAPEEPELAADNVWRSEKQNHMQARMTLIKRQPGWWLNLAPIPRGMEMLDICRRAGFDVHILTKGPKKHPNAWEEKVRWCQRHIGPEVDIHVTSDKGLVYGKLLYDDYPDYMLRWLTHRPRGLGIMPVTPHNLGFTHPNVVKWDGTNRDEVMRAVVAVKGRKPGEDLILG